jgi:biotin transport system substrate-specific component
VEVIITEVVTMINDESKRKLRELNMSEIIAGLVIDHFHQPWLQLIGMIVGTIICYVLGTAWFCFEAKSTVSGALSICVFPFIPGDLIKMIIAMLIGPAIKKRLR